MELCNYERQGKIRKFDIEAIEIPIVYNKYGDHDPDGLLYVLKKDADRIREGALRNFEQEVPQPFEDVQPLVIRANLGDELRICFSHSLNRELSMHVQGLSYDVNLSDGASVGFNRDSTTKSQICYTWYADQEGVFIFSDLGDARSSEDGTNIHGLFGAVIVEAPGSVWKDPETGKELESGLFADIYNPAGEAFREYTVFFHDELEMKDKNGEQPIDPHTGLPASTTAISYRAEPMRNRHPLTDDPADSGEEISMSSWVYGDPAPPILKAYVGDPAKIRLVHGGVKETHVFHLHNHQWRLEGNESESIILDSISISPQECYTLDILFGAGSLNRTIGDVIFHCHLYPHFHEGMWTLWRIYDRLEDGSGRLPDGTPIPPLQPLKDRKRPPKKDECHPGYPNFINGTFGEAPLQPPLGILDADGNNVIEPTPLERANFVKNFEPGALYTDTCPCHTDGCGCDSRGECGSCEEESACRECECGSCEEECVCCKEECGSCKEECACRECECGSCEEECGSCEEECGCCECECGCCEEECSYCEEERGCCQEAYDCCKEKCDCRECECGCCQEECACREENCSCCEEDHGCCENDRKPCDPDECDTDICCCPEKVRVFELALIQAKVTYNSFGWHDPQGRFFVLKEELEKHGGLESYVKKVECGEIQAEPLVIRAHAGDCVEVRLTNLLPEFLEESPFQMMTRTDIVGFHIHLVKFDTIVSDGAANGWNNIAGARRYETLVERFFANTQLNTVFFHDHLFANSHQQHGVFGALLIEDPGSTFHDIRTGEEILSGTQAVIKRKDGTSFREFALFLHDFALLFDRDGNALNPPAVPGSHDDPGVMGINYRCEPMRERLRGKEDPAYIFSSLVHGDPATPILETYPGDELMIRLLDGAHEEQHCFNIAGMSWQKELNDKKSPLTTAQPLGISEAFNLRITQDYAAGDYLYYSGGIDDAWLGLWGIIRAYEKPQKCLKPLCKPKSQLLPLPPCPGPNAVVRKYEIAAIQKNIRYNRYGDHDPDGLMFVPLSQAKAVMEGKCEPKPLILRANAGDWIEVTLHNLFDPENPVPWFDYPRVPLDEKHKPSNRVSLNPQFLQYDPVCDSGINVGFNNREQTVGYGESKKYLWKADREYGTCILQSFGDMRNHRYHGLFGAIIIEPVGACWYKNFSCADGTFEEQAVVTAPGEETFREFVTMIQNGIRLLDKDGNLIQTAQAGEDDPVDAEDTGEKGYNYRSERFANRLAFFGRISQVFNSRVHGDPATPVFKAYPGDRVIFRTLMPADKPRNVGFAVHGHTWREQPDDPASREIGLQGAISIGNRYDMELIGGAGNPGDYLYRSGSLKWDVESGMWGIFRVVKHTLGCKCRDFCQGAAARFRKKAG